MKGPDSYYPVKGGWLEDSAVKSKLGATKHLSYNHILLEIDVRIAVLSQLDALSFFVHTPSVPNEGLVTYLEHNSRYNPC